MSMQASLRDLVRTPGMWLTLGVVHVEDGETQHWDQAENGEIRVSVRLDEHEAPVWAFLSDIGGIRIPPVGTEVMVAHTGGELEGVGVIIGSIPRVSAAVAEAAATRRVLLDETWVYEGTGTPEALALKSDVQGVVDALDGHKHTYRPGTGGATTTTLNPSVPGPTGTDRIKGIPA